MVETGMAPEPAPRGGRDETRRHDPAQRTRRQRRWLIKVNQVLWLIAGVVVGLLTIRTLLRLADANPDAGFTVFIDWATAPLMMPFSGLVPSRQLAGGLLEVSAIVAMAVYVLAAWVVIRLIWILFYRPPTA